MYKIRINVTRSSEVKEYLQFCDICRYTNSTIIRKREDYQKYYKNIDYDYIHQGSPISWTLSKKLAVCSETSHLDFTVRTKNISFTQYVHLNTDFLLPQKIQVLHQNLPNSMKKIESSLFNLNIIF